MVNGPPANAIQTINQWEMKNPNIVEYKTYQDLEAPIHNPNFICELYMSGKLFAKGEGRNKKTAKENCANIAVQDSIFDDAPVVIIPLPADIINRWRVKHPNALEYKFKNAPTEPDSPHILQFSCSILLNEKCIASAIASSKKKAKHLAAAIALDVMGLEKDDQEKNGEPKK